MQTFHTMPMLPLNFCLRFNQLLTPKSLEKILYDETAIRVPVITIYGGNDSIGCEEVNQSNITDRMEWGSLNTQQRVLPLARLYKLKTPQSVDIDFDVECTHVLNLPWSWHEQGVRRSS